MNVNSSLGKNESQLKKGSKKSWSNLQTPLLLLEMNRTQRQEALRQTVENVPMPHAEGQDHGAIVRLQNIVITDDVAAQALVAGGPSGRFGATLSIIYEIPLSNALEQITRELEKIRDHQDPSIDPALFYTAKNGLRNKHGTPKTRGVFVTKAGKVRLLANGDAAVNIMYSAYLAHLLDAKVPDAETLVEQDPRRGS